MRRPRALFSSTAQVCVLAPAHGGVLKRLRAPRQPLVPHHHRLIACPGGKHRPVQPLEADRGATACPRAPSRVRAWSRISVEEDTRLGSRPQAEPCLETLHGQIGPLLNHEGRVGHAPPPQEVPLGDPGLRRDKAFGRPWTHGSGD